MYSILECNYLYIYILINVSLQWFLYHQLIFPILPLYILRCGNCKPTFGFGSVHYDEANYTFSLKCLCFLILGSVHYAEVNCTLFLKYLCFPILAHKTSTLKYSSISSKYQLYQICRYNCASRYCVLCLYTCFT